MARLVTLASLRQQSKVRADMENSNFISTGDHLDMINDSASKLYDMLVEAYQEYYEKEYTFTTTSNVTDYALPADFYKLLAVDYLLNASTGQAVSLKPFNFNERAQFALYTVGGAIIRLPYVPTYTSLAADTDTFDGINGWEQFIVLDVARKLLTKEESDTSAIMSELAEVKNAIMDLSKNRDIGMPERITDVNASSWPWYASGIPVMRYRLVGQYIRLLQILPSDDYSRGN